MLLSYFTRDLLIALFNRHAICDAQQWIFYLLTSHWPLALIAVTHKIIFWSLTIFIKIVFLMVASSPPPLFLRYAQESYVMACLYQGLFPGIGQCSRSSCLLLLEKLCSRNSYKWLAKRVITEWILSVCQFVCHNRSEPHRKTYLRGRWLLPPPFYGWENRGPKSSNDLPRVSL